MIPPGVAFAGERVFLQVEVFDMVNFSLALERLLVVETRVAIVVLETTPFEVTTDGTVSLSKMSLDISVMFSDRTWDSRTDAMLGNNATAGALNLLSPLIAAVTGNIGPSYVRPGREAGRLMLLTGPEGENNYDRVCFRQSFVASAGQIRVGLERGTIV